MVKIRVEGLNFSYRTKKVIKELDLIFDSGKITALIGPNGSGKSTLIKCVGGILPVKNKAVFIDDKDLTLLSGNTKARLMGYVPQQERQVFSSTVFETILMGRKPYLGWSPVAGDYEIINHVLLQLDLESISGEYLNELSGGQRQRVLIGRALAQQPEILLLDEPTANLDLKHQLEVMQILKRLAAMGLTIIIAVHDLNLAAKYCDRVVMLENGRIFASGDKQIFTTENIRKLYEVETEIMEKNGSKVIIPLKPL
ncbi:MAG: ABC transporter ATP-binding protein [Bacteroidales bacterium]|nr:ABC transporter ATP-binding protein [Bacteroidales bacterium]